MSLLQDAHTGSLFGRNVKKLAVPSLDRISLELLDDRQAKDQPDPKLNHEEILTQSLTVYTCWWPPSW